VAAGRDDDPRVWFEIGNKKHSRLALQDRELTRQMVANYDRELAKQIDIAQIT
jgi:hypothetical protein